MIPDNSIDDLVAKLSHSDAVTASRINKSLKMFKESIDRHYVHLLFEKTGTELGFKLDKSKCKLDAADFESGKGSVHLEGGLILNYVKVRVAADVDLDSLKGSGFLKSVDDNEYSTMNGRKKLV